MIRACFGLFLLLLPSFAFAQQETCSGYTNIELDEANARANDAFMKVDIGRAQRALIRAQNQLRCLDEPVLPDSFATFGRLRGLLAFFDEDESLATQWGVAAREASPDLEWSAMFDEDHPFRELIEETEKPQVSGVQGGFLKIPQKGAFLINGQLIWEPMTTIEIPHLVQIVDKKGNVISSMWQDGAAFSDTVLTDEAPSTFKAPRWYRGEVTEVPAELLAQRKPFPTAKVVTSASLLVASGALYALSASQVGKLNSAQADGSLGSIDDLAARRSTINLLAVGSGLTGLAAVGTSVTLLVDNSTVGVNFRF